MDPDELAGSNVGPEPTLTLDEFRRAFHQVHEALDLPDPLT